jgi:hypothetical protein
LHYSSFYQALTDIWDYKFVALDLLWFMYLSVSVSTCYLQTVTAIFPDGRAAALLKYQWKDAQFKCARYYPLRSDGFVANSQFRSKLM